MRGGRESGARATTKTKSARTIAEVDGRAGGLPASHCRHTHTHLQSFVLCVATQVEALVVTCLA